MMSPQRVADAAVTVSATSASWTWFAHATEVAQFAAAIVAVVSGICAAIYYVSKWRRERADSKAH